MSASPLVSAIIPVYNGDRFLREAVESVLNQQGGYATEVIVIDDGSTDSTPAVAGSFGNTITYVRQENQGPGAARNAGLHRATGEFIGLLDADDLWKPNKLSVQIPPLLADESVGLSWGHTETTWMAKHPDGHLEFFRHEEPERVPQLGSLLFHRSVFDQVGHFAPDLQISDDFELLIRIKSAGVPTAYQDDVVLEWRRHDANISNDVDQLKVGLVAALKRSLDRKRFVS